MVELSKAAVWESGKALSPELIELILLPWATERTVNKVSLLPLPLYSLLHESQSIHSIRNKNETEQEVIVHLSLFYSLVNKAYWFRILPLNLFFLLSIPFFQGKAASLNHLLQSSRRASYLLPPSSRNPALDWLKEGWTISDPIPIYSNTVNSLTSPYLFLQTQGQAANELTLLDCKQERVSLFKHSYTLWSSSFTQSLEEQ